MASSKRWALYATTYRLGTTHVHQLAGARLGPLGATIDYSVPYGWKFTVHVRPFHIEFGKAAGKAIVKEWYDEVIYRNPQFEKDIKAGIKSSDEGRGYHMNMDREAPMEPLASWRADDPEQPEGWHHDGGKWVLNDEGWAQDRSGFWRYTKPGDFGWVLRKDRWEYMPEDRVGQRRR